jgi:hypothetical protein
MYGDRLGQQFDAGPPALREQSALGIYMTHEIQDLATELIVHSHYAADILRLDRPLLRGEPPPVTVLPLAFPWRPRRPRRPPDPSAPLIATFGFVNEIKNPQALIEAFALLAEDRPRAGLIFAGYAAENELERWRRVAVHAGVGDRVVFGGYASENRWAELMDSADLAVQLRVVSNGEASAAAAECLGAGIPTVVTDHGWFHELPDEAVIKVPAVRPGDQRGGPDSCPQERLRRGRTALPRGARSRVRSAAIRLRSASSATLADGGQRPPRDSCSGLGRASKAWRTKDSVRVLYAMTMQAVGGSSAIAEVHSRAGVDVRGAPGGLGATRTRPNRC